MLKTNLNYAKNMYWLNIQLTLFNPNFIFVSITYLNIILKFDKKKKMYI